MKLVKVEKIGKKKEYEAIFEEDGKQFKRQFGTPNNYVGEGNKTKQDRANYRKRHGTNPLEQKALKDPTTPASLSMELLWGESKSIKKNIALYKKKYKL